VTIYTRILHKPEQLNRQKSLKTVTRDVRAGSDLSKWQLPKMLRQQSSNSTVRNTKVATSSSMRLARVKKADAVVEEAVAAATAAAVVVEAAEIAAVAVVAEAEAAVAVTVAANRAGKFLTKN
jgi:hypothetical protein